MFSLSIFDEDIGNWNVSNVTNMNSMFLSSQFNQNIGGWNVSNVINMNSIFDNSQFNSCICGWNVNQIAEGLQYVISRMQKYHFECSKKQRGVPTTAVQHNQNPMPTPPQVINGDYMKCTTCHQCFDIITHKHWIDAHKVCPNCKNPWKTNIVFPKFTFY
jgi:surface protein